MAGVRRLSRRLVGWLAAAVLLLGVALPAEARTPGQPLQTQQQVFRQSVRITLVDYAIAETDGGATLFASSAPGGPLLARVPLLPPYAVDLEGGILPTFQFNGVPPGTYYLVMVSGVVGTPNVAGSAWRQLVVNGGCPTAPPAIGTLTRDQNAAAGTLGLFLSSSDGCADAYELEAGTAPGVGNIGTLTNLLQAVTFPMPPPGVYYLRARGRNAFGAGAWSEVLPVSVPGCNSNLGQIPPGGAFNLTASVVGNTVTLTWTHATTGPAETFQELLLFHLRQPGYPVPTILLPPNLSTLSAAVPSGQYHIAVVGANGCGKSDYDDIYFTVP